MLYPVSDQPDSWTSAFSVRLPFWSRSLGVYLLHINLVLSWPVFQGLLLPQGPARWILVHNYFVWVVEFGNCLFASWAALGVGGFSEGCEYAIAHGWLVNA